MKKDFKQIWNDSLFSPFCFFTISPSEIWQYVEWNVNESLDDKAIASVVSPVSAIPIVSAATTVSAEWFYRWYVIAQLFDLPLWWEKWQTERAWNWNNEQRPL